MCRGGSAVRAVETQRLTGWWQCHDAICGNRKQLTVVTEGNSCVWLKEFYQRRLLYLPIILQSISQFGS